MVMKVLLSTPFLYIFTVLAWGSTWFAIEFQLGAVDTEVSLVYRFSLASLLLLGYCRWAGKSLRFSTRQHLWMLLLGVTLFSGNYMLLYWSQTFLTSAMASIIFSGILIFNILGARLFFATPITPGVAFGATLGVAGIVLIFWNDIAQFSLENKTALGLLIAVAGTILASTGNLVSMQMQHYQMPVMSANAYSMGYGALFSLLAALLQGKSFSWDPNPSYAISLAYLVLVGTVLAFGSYLTLLRRIGAHKASYSVVLFPAVALVLSTLFEDFQWTALVVAGLALIGAGNFFIVAKKVEAAGKTTEN